MIEAPNFLDLVAEAWGIDCFGSPMAQFQDRLKSTKQALRALNKNMGNVHSSVLAARAKLEEF